MYAHFILSSKANAGKPSSKFILTVVHTQVFHLMLKMKPKPSDFGVEVEKVVSHLLYQNANRLISVDTLICNRVFQLVGLSQELAKYACVCYLRPFLHVLLPYLKV